jgi:hypothetical protein
MLPLVLLVHTFAAVVLNLVNSVSALDYAFAVLRL